MPKYAVHFDITGIIEVEAHNKEEARQIALEDTLDGIDGVYEVGSSLMQLTYIEIAGDRGEDEIYKLDSGIEEYQCPYCDAWGYDVKNAFCKVCDVEEEEDASAE